MLMICGNCLMSSVKLVVNATSFIALNGVEGNYVFIKETFVIDFEERIEPPSTSSTIKYLQQQITKHKKYQQEKKIPDEKSSSNVKS